MVGKTLSHYKILEELGRGGMGVVYKAEDTKLGRFVALKFLPFHLSRDEGNKKRFIHEAKAASSLNHPNIVHIYEIDEADSQMFIAMEYIEGKSLQEILTDTLAKVLNLRKVLDIALQIAAGLAKAYAKQTVHRDIKPGNILISEDLVAAGRYEEAIEMYKQAQQRDPLLPYLKWRLGNTYICAGRHDEAIAHLQNTLEVEPNDPWARNILAKAYLRKSMYTEAIAASQKVVAIAGDTRWGPPFLARLGQAYAVAGRKNDALKVLNQLQERASDHFSLQLVELYIALGKKDEVLSLLEKAVEQRSNSLLYIKCSTVPDSLGDNPDFQSIMSRINFPELSFEMETRK